MTDAATALTVAAALVAIAAVAFAAGSLRAAARVIATAPDRDRPLPPLPSRRPVIVPRQRVSAEALSWLSDAALVDAD